MHVNAEELTVRERENILYNHVRTGSQDRSFKRMIRPFLKDAARLPAFSPELARWLGDPLLRRGVELSKDGLGRFFSEPLEYIKAAMTDLDNDSLAALGLIFSMDGAVQLPLTPTAENREFLEAVGSSREGATSALLSLEDSFIRRALTSEGTRWTYHHPTIRDAYAQLIAENPSLAQLYLQGARADYLVREVVCWGVSIPGSIIAIEPHYNGTLLTRLRSLAMLDQMKFVTQRASTEFAKMWLDENPDVFPRALSLERPEFGPYKASLELAAACARLGVLSCELQATWSRSVAAFLQDRSFEYLEFCSVSDLKVLLSASHLQEVDSFLREEFIGRIDRIIERRVEQYSGDENPEAYFMDLQDGLYVVEMFIDCDKYEERITRAALSEIDYQVEKLRERYIGQSEDDDYDRRYLGGFGDRSQDGDAEAGVDEERDVFDDVDED